MDTTRISIARVLALDVPLTWQDAVAVAQEAAMLSDVHAAMNSRPSLVSPETCFITRTGDLELPVTTEVESPDAVTLLLREMLAGRDAPEALESLAFGHATRDMSGALQKFPLANRRAEIAKLATRALALQARPDDAPPAIPTTVPTPIPTPIPTVIPTVIPTATPAAMTAPPSVLPGPRPVSVAAAQAPTPSPAATLPFVREAPFRAADVVRPTATVPASPAGVSSAAHDAELRRLRSKSVERAKTRRRLSARISLAVGGYAKWVTWRPSSPDPRILGAAVVVTAALVSVVWTDDRPAASVPPAPVSPWPAATTLVPGTPAAEGAAPAPATTSAPPAASAVGVTALAGPARVSAARRGGALAEARPAAPATAETVPSGELAERRPPAAPGGRGGVTVTVPALEPAPGPLTTDTGAAVRPGNSRASAADGGLGGAATVYSTSDDDVSPPVILRQQLPSAFLQPSSDVPEDWPYLELLIDRWGTVEQVRLHAKQPAPGQTLYRHRMLLAAAKAWQFEPARRNGTPVRYVMRVPLEP